MEARKSHTAEYESPKLCVVNLPEDLGLPDLPSDLLCTPRNLQQGQFHRIKSKTCRGKKTSSKYKGLSWHKTRKFWQVRIKYSGVQVWLGEHENEKEAALTYDKAALQLFGEYARTNQMIYPEDFK